MPDAERERMRGLTSKPLDPAVAARDPGLVAGVGRAADEVMTGKVGEALGLAAAGEIGRRGEEQAPRALELSSDKARIRQVANSERKVGALGDQVLVPVRHHEVDLEQRMAGEKSRQQGHDAPGAVARRQRDPEHAAQPIRAARRALGVVDRKEGVAGPAEQRLARIGGRDLPGGADKQLDRQAAL